MVSSEKGTYHRVRVSIALLKHYGQKQLGEEWPSFILQLVSPSSREVRIGTQGRNVESGTDAEAMED